MYDGSLDESTTLQEEAASIMRYNEDLHGLTVPLGNLALLAAYQGRHERALSYCREALTILRPLNEYWLVAYTLEVVATAKCLSGRYTDAAQLLGAAERLRISAGIAWPKNRISDYEKVLHTLRTGLSDEEFSRWWEAGRALSRDEAIAAAMQPEFVTDW
jgi:tetratricopeptide (TPR) repeat protein